MYTKGEWKSSYRYPHNVYATDGKRPPTTTPIATMTAPDQMEMEANAHLIASAPDLYEALVEICSILSLSCSMDYLYKHNLSLPLSKGQRAITKVEQ